MEHGQRAEPEQQEQQGQQEQEEQEEQEEEQPAEEPALPDLRIVDVAVTPDPVPAGRTARVEVTIHNEATVPASGRILVRVVHDRSGPLPVPGTVEKFLLEPDALELVSFDLHDASPRRSPYELVVAVDTADDVEEPREDNNAVSRLLVVCSDPTSDEVWDGVDNDCDGEIDDGAVPDEPGERLLRMSAEQLRSMRRAIPPVFGVAEPLAPWGVEYEVHLRASSSAYLSAARGGGGAVSADRPEAAVWETFSLLDHDGGDLRSGDTVSLRAPDGAHWIVAPGGGGAGLHARPGEAGRARLFVLVRVEGEGSVTSGDRIRLRTSSGHFVVAEGGGGGAVDADRPRAGPWETFVLEIPVEDGRAGIPPRNGTALGDGILRNGTRPAAATGGR